MREHFSFRQNLDRQAIAYLKLCVISAALNEGWTPQFTEDEYRCMPWFWIYKSREDYENDKIAEWRAGHPYYEFEDKYQGIYSGFTCANSSNAPSYTNAGFGSRFCFRMSSRPPPGWTDASSRWTQRGTNRLSRHGSVRRSTATADIFHEK